MIKVALLVTLTPIPGKEAELEAFLKSALPLAQNEPDTINWYAAKNNNGTYTIFDTFYAEQGRQAHLGGPIAAALGSKAEELLAFEPQILQLDVLASK